MKLATPFRRLAAFTAACVVVVAVPVGSNSAPAGADCAGLCAGGEYHTLTPSRIFDSRPADATHPDRPINDVAPFGAKPLTGAGADPTFDIQLLGLGGVPASAADVLAVVVGITITQPTQGGNLGAYPTGSPPSSATSILNFGALQSVPNLAVVRPGADGKLTVRLHGKAPGTAHVVVDVFGWFSTSTYTTPTVGDERGARLVPVGPGRIFDSRNGPGVTDDTPLLPAAAVPVTIRGASIIGGATIVPDSPNVVGALINVTAIRPTANTFVSVLPDTPTGMPTTSNVNVLSGQVRANLALVPVGSDGKIRVYNHAGMINVAIDVVAYLRIGDPETTRAGRVIPLTAPFRAFDTRQPAFGAVPLGPGQGEDWSFANFAGSVNIGGVSVGNQSALLGNVTNASLARQYPTVGVEPSYLTVYPADSPSRPVVSNLNSVESGPVANMAMVRYGANQTVRVFNLRGYAHYLIDVSAVVLAD